MVKLLRAVGGGVRLGRGLCSCDVTRPSSLSQCEAAHKVIDLFFAGNTFLP